MKSLRVIGAGLIGVTVLLLPASRAVAVTSYESLSGGNKASDYQPTTDNPQGNVSSGLQTTNSSLQPVPGQTGVTQQTLGTARDLRVVGTNGKPNPNTTSTVVVVSKKTPSYWLLYVALGAGAIGTGLYFGLKQQKSTKAVTLTDESKPQPTSPAEPSPQPKKHKKSPAKKNQNKRSNKKKKSKK